MIRRLSIPLVITLCLLTLTLSAQDDTPQYQLYTPSVEEYMRAIPTIVEQSYEDDTSSVIRHMAADEFNLRYHNVSLGEFPFELLHGFQEWVAIGADPLLRTDIRPWFMGMLEAGIRDVGITDFSQPFTLGDFQITPTPVDFDGDGSEAYLLEVYDDMTRRTFYALVDETVFAVPLPIIGVVPSGGLRGIPESGLLHTRVLSDIDGDGDMEWIVEGDTYGYWSSCNDLYVIDWIDGELVDRTGDLFHYCIYMAQADTSVANFSYTQPDDIRLTYRRVDGWKCAHTQVDQLGLLSNTLETSTTYSDTVWCDLREAGIAFDSGDYETAALIYRQAIEETDGQMALYLTARLALSYALNNQIEEVQQVLNNAEPTGQMGDLLLRLQAVSHQPEQMCLTAYTFFDEINNARKNEYDNPYEWTPPHFYFGRLNRDPRQFPMPLPEQAGCDYERVTPILPTPIPTLNIQPDWDFLYILNFDVYGGLLRGDYETTLLEINKVIAMNRDDYGTEFMYWKALTLELMDHPNEALAEYVAIYEAAPESAWGMLAALHIEEIDE